MEDQESGSFQLKAKRKYESGCERTVKRAPFRSRTLKKEVVGEMLYRRLYGLLASGLSGITASFMRWQS